MKIELTDNEIEVVMKALEHFTSAPHSIREGVCIDEINEIADDIREQDCRRHDGWGIDAEINAETQMFNAGADAREKMKATSRAADRRALNLAGPSTDSDRSEMQDVDVWAPPSNDPAKW
jgi:hypothetical protein